MLLHRFLVLCALTAIALPAHARGSAKKPPARGSGSARHFTYKVVRGDSLQCLDSRFHIQPGELAMLNGGRAGATSYSLVVGRTINVPVRVPPNACARFNGSGGSARLSAHDQACQLVDRTKRYSQQQALRLLTAISHNRACLRAAEIIAQPSVESVCEAVGHLLHSNHHTHAYASSIEALCQTAHIAAHGLHQAQGHGGGSHGSHGSH